MGDIQSGFTTTSTFSPDGRWFAYTSNEGGVGAIFVQPFPLTGAKNRIAVGRHPRWSPDGKQLSFFRVGQYQIVNVTTQPSFTFGNPTPLPAVPAFGNNPSAPTNYDITPDGRRFIIVTQAGQSPSGAPTMPQIHVVLNWLEELRARVPSR